jgi:hypothetical protein
MARRLLSLSRRWPAIAVGALVLVGLMPPAVASAQMATEGEYGLRVTDADGEIGVGWLTAGVEAGVLRVTAGDAVLLDVETTPAGAHYVTFLRPAVDVELHYGVAGQSPLYSTTLFLAPEPPPESGELTGVDSLYAVGDVHGEYDHLTRLLGNAGLIDDDTHWIGGTRHVAFLGDLFDRGSDVTRTLWLLYRLEREARSAGGGAHVVLGNHEAMVFTNDLRYVTPKEQLVARLHGVSYTEMYDIRRTILGRWLASRPGLMLVDGALMAHGGVVPELQPHSVAAVNDSLRAYLAEDLFYRWADTTVALATDSATAEAARDQYAEIIVMDSASVARRMALIFNERSILWYRGYVQEDTLSDALDEALAHFDADLHVVGHTSLPTITSRYEGRLLAVDLEDHARELLLIVRDAAGSRELWVIGLEGAPRRL